MYINKNHVPINEIRELYRLYMDTMSLEDQIENPTTNQLELALENSDGAIWKLLHPIFIKAQKTPMAKYGDTPISLIGCDIETQADTGLPMLLGLSYPNGMYQKFHKPDLDRFANIIRARLEDRASLITWGNLDLQCIIRLFNPDDTERRRLSRGISASIKNRSLASTPPISRKVRDGTISILHYFPGRALKVALTRGRYTEATWIYNASQFWPTTIAQTAKGLGLAWNEYDKDTHIIDWQRYETDQEYQFACIDSNKQDAHIVRLLGQRLQQMFYNGFKCYPTILVSTGSLVDAAVGMLLDNGTDDYQSNSFRWLVNHSWRQDLTYEQVSLIETILSDCYSAGYVDQYAVGYFPSVWTADISSAYPAVIRNLPDLRLSKPFVGKGKLAAEIRNLKGAGWHVETAFIRGIVTIPETLKYHPITVKTPARENIRPIGTFWAGYTLEERVYCQENKALFNAESEEYVIIAFPDQPQTSPIAEVSIQLGEMRDETRAQMKGTEGDEKAVLDGLQYIFKIIDNSLYGKTVQTTETVEDIDGVPTVTGYVAGDRFNLLFGSIITARTRVLLSRAMNSIARAGGKPIMGMTDSVYWEGSFDDLPTEFTSPEKKAGYFEEPQELNEMFVLKTGQYEYRDPTKAEKPWTYKLRGLPVIREYLSGEASFLRDLIVEHCANLPPDTTGKSIEVPVNTRRLISVGKNDLDHLGMLQDGTTLVRPFVLSSKNVETYINDWQKCLTGAVWLIPLEVAINTNPELSQPPLTFLTTLYKERSAETVIKGMKKKRQERKTEHLKEKIRKGEYVLRMHAETGIDPPSRWQQRSMAFLREHFGEMALVSDSEDS